VSGLKTIRRRITSVSNTKQITRAMKLVSAAKLRRAQDAALGGRSFSERLGEIASSVKRDLPEDFSHPLMQRREVVKRRRVIVVSGERGLCGAYNSNMSKAVLARDVAVASTEKIALEFVPLGRRSVAFVNFQALEMVSDYGGLPEEAALWPISEVCDDAIKAFSLGRCDEVVLYYTKFISTMTQEVIREVLLPFGEDADEAVIDSSPDVSDRDEQASGAAQYEPSAEEIFDKLLPLLIKTRVTQGGLESKASEHAARMTAMDSATRNANELIDTLRLFYNRARQSAITTELIDIVGGAEAQQ